MYCEHCGEDIEDTSQKYCPLCGSNIQKAVPMKKGIGSYSKKSFKFSIVSLSLVPVGIIIGFIVYLLRKNVGYEADLSSIFIMFFGVSSHIIGLIFGILGILKAENTPKKVGIILCIIGIIANVVGILIYSLTIYIFSWAFFQMNP
ncbi:MAG: zinc ribbon domain-containing protein [Candidatus Lokiarchaeota archaeon]|nr:zinc ribbon domain-containing protein [Candidatus Lokiarchaeota archaeon]